MEPQTNVYSKEESKEDVKKIRNNDNNQENLINTIINFMSINITKGKFILDKLTKMNIYCVIEIYKLKFKTNINTGKNPVWN